MLTWFLKLPVETDCEILHGLYVCVISKIAVKPDCVILDEPYFRVNIFWYMFLTKGRAFAAFLFRREGLYQSEIFFGIVHQDRYYLKASIFTKTDSLAFEMTPPPIN
jgi:hypothetical protein